MTAPPATPLVIRPVLITRQFAATGTIQSLGIALFVGFLALATLKLAADALGVGGPGANNLPFALAWSAAAFSVSALGLWALHYRTLVVERSRTSYAVLLDRVEVRRDGRPDPVDLIPLGRTIAVQVTAGPYQRPHGAGTVTLVVEEPPDARGRSRHVFHPLPNVPDPEGFADMIRSRIAARATA